MATQAAMDVIPIPLTDRMVPIPRLRTRTFFHVEARLDAAVLEAALDTLIRQHWRKLGGRVLRDAQSGELQYHVPKAWEAGYRLYGWSWREAAEGERAQDVVPWPQVGQAAATAAAAGEAVAVQAFLPATEESDDRLRPAAWPYNFVHDTPDTPLLLAHLTVYADASVLMVSLPHLVSDQMGLGNIIRAWLGLADGGRPPPPLTGYGADPLPHDKVYADYQPHELADGRRGKLRRHTWWESLLVACGFIPEFVLHRKEVGHTVFIPHAVLRPLRQRVVREAEAQHGASLGISDGDVLTGILVKFAFMHTKSACMVTLTQAVNMRGRIPVLSGPAGDGFIHNALLYGCTRLSVGPDTLLSEIAYSNRLAVAEALAPAEIDVTLAVLREMTERQETMLACEPLELSFAITNWSAAWRGLDFSAAAVKRAGLEEEKKSGEPEKPQKPSKASLELGEETSEPSRAASPSKQPPRLFVFGRCSDWNMPRRFTGVILGRNDAGYWCDLNFAPRTWNAIDAYLAKDPKLEQL